MILNTRSRQILERDYTIGSHQSGISGRYQIPRNGLVGEWKLDGDALDTSGSGNNGTATDVTYTNTDRGYQKQCGVFNGISSKIDTALVGLLNNFSVSIWATKGDDDSLVYSCYNSYIAFTSSGNPQAVYYDSGGVTCIVSSGMTISDNNFHHLVWRKSSSGGQQFYVDGVLKGTDPSISNINAGYNSNVGIGFLKHFNANFHSGQIQGAKYFNRVISEQEIQSLYMEGLKLLH